MPNPGLLTISGSDYGIVINNYIVYHNSSEIAIGFSKKIKVFFAVPKKIPPICCKISPVRVRTRLKAVRISVTGRKQAQKIKTHIIMRRKT